LADADHQNSLPRATIGLDSEQDGTERSLLVRRPPDHKALVRPERNLEPECRVFLDGHLFKLRKLRTILVRSDPLPAISVLNPRLAPQLHAAIGRWLRSNQNAGTSVLQCNGHRFPGKVIPDVEVAGVDWSGGGNHGLFPDVERHPMGIDHVRIGTE
jgi:hypothetical protein